jgi:hypothetical protein
MAGSDQISTSALSEAEAALVRRPPARAATATIAAAIMIITAIGAHAVSMKIHPFSPALPSHIGSTDRHTQGMDFTFVTFGSQCGFHVSLAGALGAPW